MDIQNLRDFQRPFLTMLFATSYVICVMSLVIAVVVWFFTKSTGEADLLKMVPVILGIIGLIGTPLGAIMGYHFAKSSKKDTTP